MLACRLLLIILFVPWISFSAVLADVTDDFSIVANPTPSGWSYWQGGLLLSQTQSTAAAWGVAGQGWYASRYPGVVFQASGSEFDWQPGDVVTHTPNDLTPTIARWTSDYAGLVTVQGSIWGTRVNTVPRNTEYSLWVNGVLVAAGSYLDGATSRNAPDLFGTGPLNIGVGGEIELRMQRTANSRYGDFAGITLTVSTYEPTEVPEPATTILAVAGLAAIGALKRR